MTFDDFVIDIDTAGVHEKSPPRALRKQSIDEPTFYVDEYKRIRRPRLDELVGEFKRIVFTCATMNANAVAQVPIRLFVKTESGQLRPKCKTKSLSKKTEKRLTQIPAIRKQLRTAQTVEEVTEHPVLELLDKVNDFPTFDGFKLRVLGQLYQEIVGKDYWYIVNDRLFNIPKEIWPIPAHKMEAKKEPDSNKIFDYYEYNGFSTLVERFEIDEIISYLVPDPISPYANGYSWVEAAWEDVKASNGHIANELSMLDNETRPDAILSPKNDDASMSKEMADQYEIELNRKFARGGRHKISVLHEALDLKPLTFSPRDMGELATDRRSVNMICLCAGVPLPLLFTEDVNRANHEFAREQHALNTVSPRLNRNISVMNEALLTRYDNSGRLFFGFDDPVPENRQLKLQENVQTVMNGIKTPNEARDVYDLPPLPDGDELRPINVSPDIMRQNERDSGEAER